MFGIVILHGDSLRDSENHPRGLNSQVVEGLWPNPDGEIASFTTS